MNRQIGNAMLSTALRNKAASVRLINVTTEKDDSLIRDAADLLRVLANVVEGKSLRKALGAPGDWGYETDIGQAISAWITDPGFYLSNGNTESVIAAVMTEREKQVAGRYTPDHDDEHTCGELVQAAADLCLFGTGLSIRDAEFSPWQGWGITEKHAGDRRKQLVIAAALIFAEIERLDRAAAKSKGGAA